VVRVQAYPFPFLSPQRTRPLPYPRGHRDSAEIVQQPSPVNGSRVGGRGQPGCGARQRGDPPRVAGEPRALQVGGVPEPGQGLFEGRIVAEGAPGRGLGVSHRCPRVIRAAGRQQFARRVREDSGNLWIERAPGPASHGPGRDIAATDGVEHHRRIADRGESRRLGDVRASPAQWNTLAVEALEAVQDSPPDRLRQPQPSRQIRADLAVRSRPLSLPTPAGPPSARNRAASTPRPSSVASRHARTASPGGCPRARSLTTDSAATTPATPTLSPTTASLKINPATRPPDHVTRIVVWVEWWPTGRWSGWDDVGEVAVAQVCGDGRLESGGHGHVGDQRQHGI
jgi:hypothetical protein